MALYVTTSQNLDLNLQTNFTIHRYLLHYVFNIHMLVTTLRWWLHDSFKMLVVVGLWCRLFVMHWWLVQCDLFNYNCFQSVTNMSNRSSRSQSCHQCKPSRTSVTNIDVATRTSLTGGRVTSKYDFCLVWQYCLAFRMLVTLETRWL